jgi:hypothetical protein
MNMTVASSVNLSVGGLSIYRIFNKSVIIAPIRWGEHEGKTRNLRVVRRDGCGAERQGDVQGAQGQHGRVQEVRDHLRLKKVWHSLGTFSCRRAENCLTKHYHPHTSFLPPFDSELYNLTI